MYQANGQFFSHEGWDQRTMLNQPTPEANNVFPQVIECPPLAQGTSRLVSSHIRFRLEQGLNKSPVHIATYNMFSQSMWQNQTFTDATYYATNLIAYMITTQGTQGQEAFNKAVAYVCIGYLARVLETHQHLYQITPPDIVQKLSGASQKLQQIIQDVNGYVQQMQSGQMPGGHMQGQHPHGGLPANNLGGAVNHAGRVHQQQPVQPYHQTAQVNGPRVHQPGSTGQGSGYSPPSSAAFHRQPAEPANQQVIEEWGSSNMNKTAVEPQPAQQTVLDDRTDVPQSIEEVVFDPYHYIPQGVNIDPQRPYDKIHVPGGIELVLAHKSKFVPSKNDVAIYPLCVDPSVYCHYYLVWPDGFVQDYFVEWNDDMLYIQHELNAELRGAHIKPDGKLTKNSRHVSQVIDAPKSTKELKSRFGDDIEEHHVLEQPLFVEETFITSSRMEDEETVLQAIKADLGWEEPVDEVPAHIYMTEQLHPIEVDKEAEDRLFALMTAESIKGVVWGLKELLKDDLISLRVYRFINERFTDVVNNVLRDNMSLDDFKLGSFVNDYEELLDIFKSETQYDGMDVILEGKASKVIQLAMPLRLVEGEEEDDSDRLYIVDQQINYRVGFELTQLADLVKTDEAKLISSYSTPNLSKLVVSFIKDAKQKRGLPGRMQIITADGVYLEILIGWLGDNNYLIKRLPH